MVRAPALGRFLALAVLLMALPVYAQTPTPTPDDRIAPSEVGLPSDLTEDPALRTAASATFHKGGLQKTSIVWGRPHFYRSGGTGPWRQKKPRFVSDGADDVTVGNDLVVRLTNSPTRIQITDANGDGVAFSLPARAVRTSETTFTASVGQITLTYTLGPMGVKAEATISAKQGSRTWTIDYTPLGTATATIDADGALVIGGFRVPRPFATGADGRRYDVGGPWALQAGTRARVTLDDSALPATAVPYVLDPTTIYSATTDGIANGGDATYTIAQSTFQAATSNTTTYIVGQTVLSVFIVRRIYLAFDTGAALPDTAAVTDARLGMKWVGDYSTTDFDIQVRKYAWTTFDTDASYDGCIAASVDQTLANSSQYQYNQYRTSATSLDVTWVTVTGSTTYCLTSSRDASVTQPSGDEYVEFYSADSAGTGNDPYLSVTYTEIVLGCCNCSGITTWAACQGPVVVANTPTCPTQTPNGPACTYVENSSCIVK